LFIDDLSKERFFYIILQVETPFLFRYGTEVAFFYLHQVTRPASFPRGKVLIKNKTPKWVSLQTKLSGQKEDQMILISETANDDRLLEFLKETLPKESPEKVHWTFLSRVEAVFLDWWGTNDIGHQLDDMDDDDESREISLLWESLTEDEQIDVMKRLKTHVFDDDYYLSGNHAIVENLELAVTTILRQRESVSKETRKEEVQYA